MAEFDPMDPFRLTPEEISDLELRPDFIPEEEEEEEETSGPSATAPNPTPEPTAPPTGGAFDKSKDFSHYEAQGMSRGEWNRKQMETGTGAELEGFAEDPRYAAELAAAVPTGGLDFGIDAVNLIPGINIPKPTKFENEVSQATRDVSSVLLPTLFGAGVLRGAGVAANSRVGWSIGQNRMVQHVGAMGVDALAGLTVDAISSQSEEDNLAGTLKKSFPKTYDWIPDNYATLEGDSPDMKRAKNIKEGVGLGVLSGLLEGAVKFSSALGGAKNTIRTYGESAESADWLAKNARRETDNVQETIENALIRQEEALDEVGYYNINKGDTDLDQPIRGVDDLFEYTESGSRTVDDLGIVGASIDQVRISKNYDTVYGRLGNAVSESAMDYAVQSAENTMDVVLGLARQLDEAGPIGQRGRNWNVTPGDVIKQGDIQAAMIFDPEMPVEQFRQIMEPMTVVDEFGAPVLTEDGYAGVMKALGMYRKELSGMTIARAEGLAMNSISGQVADLAESARLLYGTPAKAVAEDRILEHMKFLMQAKNTTDYYVKRKKSMMNLISRGFRSPDTFKQITTDEMGGVLAQITKDTDRFFKNARTIRSTNPEAFDNLLFAYELTDGKIDTMQKLSKYVDASVTDLGKGIINMSPEAENMFISGIWSNVYNSVLSGIGTPIAAMVGNIGGIIAKPVATFGGALINKDMKTLQRSWMAYSAIGDTLGKALPYAGSVFRKASQDPESVKGVVRMDLQMARQDKMELLKNIAKTESDKGNDGLKYLVDKIELLDDMARSPFLRAGPNALTAVDGLTSSFIANANARFMALDELASSGEKITRANVKAIADKQYAEMFDANGLITDKATKWASDEIALNVNSPIASGVQDATKYVPGLKPFLMFQTTGVNMVEMFGKYSPTVVAFQRDVNDLAFTPLRKLLANEDKIDELLTARGHDITTMDPVSKANRIAEIQAETKGRKAIGTLAVGSAISLMLNDRLTGDGLYDKEAQRARVKMGGWKPRSIKGPDGKYYSYEGLGPIADLMAMVANVSDNFDMIGETATENLFNKISFMVGAAITDRTALSGLEPLMQMAGGNGASLTRWSSGFANSLGPLGGLRNDFSKILSEGLREVDTDFGQYLQNRNLYTEHLDPENRLPFVYNPIDGKVPNNYGLLQRLWNAYSPIKVHDGQSEEQEFITAYEYDLNTTFKTREGVSLSPQERSALFKLMGEQGVFKQELRSIMKDAKDWRTIAELHTARRNGITSEDAPTQTWRNIGTRIRQAQNYAEELAFASLDAEMRNDIESRIMEGKLRTEASTEGNLLDENLNIRK